MVVGSPRMCINTTGIPNFAAISGAPSRLNLRTSFQISAPACTACSITFGELVSIDNHTSSPNFWRIASTTGTTRAHSSTSVTGLALGRVDSPPISIMVAPSFNICSQWVKAVFIVLNFPPSENESGVTFKMPIICG